MRLLLYNPNTDRDLTGTLAAALRKRLGKDDSLTCATAPTGPAFIGSDAAIVAARAALQDALVAGADRCDAVLLGCFGDLAGAPLRRLIRIPIISLSDAFFAIAPLLPGRVGIVTTSAFWAERLAHDARQCGQTVPIAPLRETGTDLLARCQAAIAEIAANGNCDAVVLGGALLAVLHTDLVGAAALPVIDILAPAVELCRTAAACRVGA